MIERARKGGDGWDSVVLARRAREVERECRNREIWKFWQKLLVGWRHRYVGIIG